MNIKKTVKDEVVRVLKTDEEVISDNMSNSDRILMLKARAKAACVISTPEMVEIIKEIARSDMSSKVRLEAAKTIVSYGLGTPDKEQIIPHGNPNEKMDNKEIDAILELEDENREP